MTLWNVSTVMAPNLFLPRGRPPKLTKDEKQLAEGAAEVVCMMVQYQDLLWTVSGGSGSGSVHPSICLSVHLSITVSTILHVPGAAAHSPIMGAMFHAAT